jgi:alanine racemase
MVNPSQIEISRSALENNLDFIRRLIGENCRLSAVVKGNAYGHDITVYAGLAYSCGVRHFSVFSALEAERVFTATAGKAEVMIMGMLDPADMEWVIRNRISFFVFDLERLEAALPIAKRLGIAARIHIELETGLNRTGFNTKGLQKLVKTIEANAAHIEVEGACTHYAGAESIANHFRIQRQINTFNRLYNWLKKKGIHPKMRHTACSAAAISYPKTRMDMVRIGIMQYGYWPSRETLITYLNKHNLKQDPLQRLMRWKSKVMNVKTVKPGEFIGYGTTYMTENEMRIAVVAVGYAEGYSRSLSNQGRILIGGHRVSVIGMVNMNMLLADVTNVAEAAINDEVVLIGEQNEQVVSVSSFSELSDQLNYELLTRLPHAIPRTITE